MHGRLRRRIQPQCDLSAGYEHYEARTVPLRCRAASPAAAVAAAPGVNGAVILTDDGISEAVLSSDAPRGMDDVALLATVRPLLAAAGDMREWRGPLGDGSRSGWGVRRWSTAAAASLPLPPARWARSPCAPGQSCRPPTTLSPQ
jgi:hypothetical protein